AAARTLLMCDFSSWRSPSVLVSATTVLTGRRKEPPLFFRPSIQQALGHPRQPPERPHGSQSARGRSPRLVGKHHPAPPGPALPGQPHAAARTLLKPLGFARNKLNRPGT